MSPQCPGAYLSLGIDPAVLGKRIKEIKDLGFKKPYVKGMRITGEIIHIDRFGNLITNIDEGLLRKVFKNRRFKVEVCGNVIEKVVTTYSYAKKDEIISLIGSSGLLEIAKRDADAGQELGAKKGDVVKVRLKSAGS